MAAGNYKNMVLRLNEDCRVYGLVPRGPLGPKEADCGNDAVMAIGVVMSCLISSSQIMMSVTSFTL